jgi:hypothetical protein
MIVFNPRAGPQIPGSASAAYLRKVTRPPQLPAPGLEAIPMTSLLHRAIAAVRAWLGMNDPAEDRLHPSHGWLLPPVAPVRAPSELPPGERR